MKRKVTAKRRTYKSAFDLERFLPYLLNRVGIRIAIEFAREIKPQQVKYSSWRVLFTLMHLGPQQIVDLAALANFEISTLSRVIVGLEHNGLVERVDSDAGARNPGVGLTKRGEDLIKQLSPTLLKHERAALRGFSAAEHKQLIALLARLHQNLNRYYAERK